MKFKKLNTYPFQDRKVSQLTVIAIVSGVVVGAAIGALYATTAGRAMKTRLLNYTGDLFNRITGNTKTKANQKLGQLITDVRSHIKKNADGLLLK